MSAVRCALVGLAALWGLAGLPADARAAEPADDAAPAATPADTAHVPNAADGSAEAKPPETGTAWSRALRRGVSRATFQHVLIDLRGFYHYTDGVGGQRPDWRGIELLSYLDVLPDVSAAAIVRQEFREEAGTYGSLMIVPRIGDDLYSVFTVGMGGPAAFLPHVRLDYQLRGLLPHPSSWIMLDGGITGVWWSDQRVQFAESFAVVLWMKPFILELRETVFFTYPGFGAVRVNPHGLATLLWGEEGAHWLVVKLDLGTEPENVPGKAFAETRDLFVGSVAVGGRWWLDETFGVMAEIEFFGQVETWLRVGGTVSAFAEF